MKVLNKIKNFFIYNLGHAMLYLLAALFFGSIAASIALAIADIFS